MTNGKESTKKLSGEVSCIKVSPETKRRLIENGKMGDTFDKVISNILDKNCEKITGESNGS